MSQDDYVCGGCSDPICLESYIKNAISEHKALNLNNVIVNHESVVGGVLLRCLDDIPENSNVSGSDIASILSEYYSFRDKKFIKAVKKFIFDIPETEDQQFMETFTMTNSRFNRIASELWELDTKNISSELPFEIILIRLIVDCDVTNSENLVSRLIQTFANSYDYSKWEDLVWYKFVGEFLGIRPDAVFRTIALFDSVISSEKPLAINSIFKYAKVTSLKYEKLQLEDRALLSLASHWKSLCLFPFEQDKIAEFIISIFMESSRKKVFNELCELITDRRAYDCIIASFPLWDSFFVRGVPVQSDFFAPYFDFEILRRDCKNIKDGEKMELIYALIFFENDKKLKGFIEMLISSEMFEIRDFPSGTNFEQLKMTKMVLFEYIYGDLEKTTTFFKHFSINEVSNEFLPFLTDEMISRIILRDIPLMILKKIDALNRYCWVETLSITSPKLNEYFSTANYDELENLSKELMIWLKKSESEFFNLSNGVKDEIIKFIHNVNPEFC